MPYNSDKPLTLANALRQYEEVFGTKTYERFIVQSTSGIHVFVSMDDARKFYDTCTESGVSPPEPLSEQEYLQRYFSSENSDNAIIQH